jgi:peptidoglycan hydrolase-like protein with peptidoglycan-binding domain
MKLGDRNSSVLMLQKCLKYEGVFPMKVEPTGYFGVLTVQSVKLFQATNGIIQTGNVGSLTRAKLNELFK